MQPATFFVISSLLWLLSTTYGLAITAALTNLKDSRKDKEYPVYTGVLGSLLTLWPDLLSMLVLVVVSRKVDNGLWSSPGYANQPSHYAPQPYMVPAPVQYGYVQQQQPTYPPVQYIQSPHSPHSPQSPQPMHSNVSSQHGSSMSPPPHEMYSQTPQIRHEVGHGAYKDHTGP